MRRAWRPLGSSSEAGACFSSARLASGESLLSICTEEQFPAESTVRGWVLDDREGFAAKYARAREMQADRHAEQIVALDLLLTLVQRRFEALLLRFQLLDLPIACVQISIHTWR